MSETLFAWIALIFGWLLPLAHVAFAPSAGPWAAPPGSRCPFGPRLGWLVMMAMLGPIGWLLFVLAPRRRGRRPETRSPKT